MRTLFAVGAALALTVAACGDSAGPGGPGFLIYGRPYALRMVNGAPLPWSMPERDTIPPLMITQGTVTFLDGSQVQRDETMLRWVLDGQGDSVANISAWSRVAPFRREGGKIIITNLSLPPSVGFGPPAAQETLYVAATGRLVMRETGYLPPLDSIVRVYCTTPAC